MQLIAQNIKKNIKYNNYKKNFIYLLLIIFFSLYLVPTFNKMIQRNNYYNKKKNKIYNNFRADVINGKLYWNNEISLNLDYINKDIQKFKNYSFSFEKKENFIKRRYPKVSVVTTLHNQENYIKLIYSSIFIQELKDIEIIFVDDASNDNTQSIMKQLMKNDKRIIYLKNHKNKRAFYSRNRGVLEAKGEYIIVVDPDDLLVNNILIKAYETAKKFNLDIFKFLIYISYFIKLF